MTYSRRSEAEFCRQIIALIGALLHDFVLRGPFFDNIAVVRAESVVDALLVTGRHEYLGMSYLNDLYAFDNMGTPFRFTVVYKFSNPALKTGLIVLTASREGAPIPTLQNLCRAASWPEREA